jgi:nitroimidazol reductase NimA-like FMN-containing flavoprotein (pyridoxamine 5'-phosphate oxidase superfamily)
VSSPFFYTMRRKEQQLDQKAIQEVLTSNTSGVLSLFGVHGYPYGVPLNYVFYRGDLYFHSIDVGMKIQALEADPRCCFTVIDADHIASELYTSLFRSVIVTGTIQRIEGQVWLEAFDALCDALAPDRPTEERRMKVRSCSKAIGLVLRVEAMTGKQAKELAGVSYL